MRIRFDDAMLWISYGFLLGVAVTGLLVLFPLMSDYQDFLKNYQTLVGSILALLGALLTVLIIAIQIVQSQDADEQRRRDRLRAARSVLPFALSQISQYAEDCIEAILPLLPTNDQAEGFVNQPPNPVIAPKLPEDALPILKECIESSEPEAAKALSEIATMLQIRNSRFHALLIKIPEKIVSTMHISVLSSYDVRRRIIDFIELQAKTSKLFDYARGKSEHVDQTFTLQDITNAAFNCDVGDEYVTIWKLFNEDFGEGA
jgi:hypothetical protein